MAPQEVPSHHANVLSSSAATGKKFSVSVYSIRHPNDTPLLVSTAITPSDSLLFGHGTSAAIPMPSQKSSATSAKTAASMTGAAFELESLGVAAAFSKPFFDFKSTPQPAVLSRFPRQRPQREAAVLLPRSPSSSILILRHPAKPSTSSLLLQQPADPSPSLPVILFRFLGQRPQREAAPLLPQSPSTSSLVLTQPAKPSTSISRSLPSPHLQHRLQPTLALVLCSHRNRQQYLHQQKPALLPQRRQKIRSKWTQPSWLGCKNSQRLSQESWAPTRRCTSRPRLNFESCSPSSATHLFRQSSTRGSCHVSYNSSNMSIIHRCR